MTQTNRALSAQEQTDIAAILGTSQIAYLAVADADPYVVPINFVHDPTQEPGRILFHTGEGRKSRALENDPRVCLSILAEATFDPAEEPCNDGFAYRSIIIEGKALRLEGKAQREHALRMLILKYDRAAFRRPLSEEQLAKTLIYAVSLRGLSYKQRRKRS